MTSLPHAILETAGPNKQWIKFASPKHIFKNYNYLEIWQCCVNHKLEVSINTVNVVLFKCHSIKCLNNQQIYKGI